MERSDGGGMWGRMRGHQGLSVQSLANLVQWGDELRVEHPAIDAQHEGIFKLVSEVYKLWREHADIEALRAVVVRLGKVLEAHFNYEEQELARVGYPNLVNHRSEHRAMLRELAVVRERIEKTGQSHAYPEPGWIVLNFLLGVTVGHILHSDMDYYVHLHKPASASESEEGLGTVS